MLPRMRMTFGGGQLGEEEDALGEVRVSSRRRGDGWSYEVETACVVTGERGRLWYETDGRALGAMRGAWRVEAAYETPDALKRWRSEGRIEPDGEVRLRPQSRPAVSLGRAAGPVAANWTLFDTVAAAAEAGPFSVLEGGERLKPGARVRPVGEWTCRAGEAPLALRGYRLSGTGLEPQYWWVDEAERVIFMSTINATYVLEGCRRAETSGNEARPRVRTEPRGVSPTGAAERPNVLFINTDQQTWDAISSLGNQWVKTPAIDRLMASGVRFDRAYCTDPVCCPARSSWASGRYSSETGCLYNGGLMHEDIPDAGQLLRAAGYRAVHGGKWHVDGRDVRASFETLYYGARHIGAGCGELYDPASVRSVVDFLGRHDGAVPFYLQLGLVNPHDICEFEHCHEENAAPDPVAAGLVREEGLPPMPPNFTVGFRELLGHEAFHRSGRKNLMHGTIRAGVREWTENHWRYLAWNLYRYTERADQDIGVVLSALDASSFRDNTLIIFSVDHGEAAGRHGLFQKFSLYEEAIRTPLVVSELGSRFGIPKGREDAEHLVSGVDLLPTILDYAGAEVRGEVRGRSLRPLIEGRTPGDWREFAYVESNVWGRAMVGRRWKYIMEYVPRADGRYLPPRASTHAVGRELLFDLAADPLETRDVGAEHPAELAPCRAALGALEETLETRPLRADSRGPMDAWRASILSRASG
jgi:arylsulfatase A-like enzyme